MVLDDALIGCSTALQWVYSYSVIIRVACGYRRHSGSKIDLVVNGKLAETEVNTKAPHRPRGVGIAALNATMHIYIYAVHSGVEVERRSAITMMPATVHHHNSDDGSPSRRTSSTGYQ